MLHVTSVRSTTQLYSCRRCTWVLRFLGNHKFGSLAYQGEQRFSQIQRRIVRSFVLHLCYQVGSKTVEQQVMLVESSYFPVILGRYVSTIFLSALSLISHLRLTDLLHSSRSFMERRGVRTDPLDQTSVVFMDTNEAIPTDLVIVKDKQGRVVPIS